MKYKYTYRLLSYLVMCSIFLPIVQTNMPWPLSSHYFWLLLWFTYILFVEPKFYFKKRVLYVLFYAVFFYLFFATIWINVSAIDKQRIWSEIIALFGAITMMEYYIQKKDYNGLGKLACVSIIFISITATTTIIALHKYPFASRDLAGALAREGMFNVIDKYKRLGIGGYDFVGAIVFLFPSLFFLYRKAVNKYKAILILLILTLLYFQIQAKYFANILFTLLTILFSFMSTSSTKKKFFTVAIIILIVLAVPIDFYIVSIKHISYFFKSGSLLNEKLNDLALYITSEGKYSTGIEDRAQRIPMLLSYFVSNPIFGTSIGNAHLHWLNKLALFGLIGTIPFFILLYVQYVRNVSIFENDFAHYYKISIMAFLGLGVIKSMLGKTFIYMIFLIIPSIYYIKFTSIAKCNNLIATKNNNNN